jgi:regulator of sigma E protease
LFGLPTWLVVIPVLAFVIFIHELGHFVTAKKFGIKVTEFGFGFPPRLLGFRHGETTYTLNLIPLGGFVKMVGEEDPTEPRSFASQSVLKRVIVLCAGVAVNFVVPVIIFTILFTLPQDTLFESVIVTNVAPRSPAEAGGLRPGDTIISVNGQRIDNRNELRQQVFTRLGASTELTVKRGLPISGFTSSPELATIETLTVVPRFNPPDLTVVEELTDPKRQVTLAEAHRIDPEASIGDTVTQGEIGFWMGVANQRIVKRSHAPWNAFPMAVDHLRDVLTITKNGIVRWAVGGPDPFIGHVGIAQVTGEVVRAGISPVFEWIAIISLSLGIVNILPIPPLDGGRLMFVLLEWGRKGKRISPQREGLVHMVGFVMLISFIIVMNYRDIVRLLNGESFIR